MTSGRDGVHAMSAAAIPRHRTTPTPNNAPLGGMLLSSDAIVDVMGRVAARDFYRPAHEMTFDAITHLHGRVSPSTWSQSGMSCASGRSQKASAVWPTSSG